MANQPPPEPMKVRFSLGQLFYFLAVFGCVLALFRSPWVLLSVVGLGFVVWNAAVSKPFFLLEYFGMMVFYLGLLIPVTEQIRDGFERRPNCANSLKQLALAMIQYHDEHRRFPSTLPTEDGKTTPNWRVELLLYLEHSNLFEMYDVDEPWNGPKNRGLSTRMPWCFECKNDDGKLRIDAGGQTNYLAIAADPKCWPANNDASAACPLILFVEVPNKSVPWLSPDHTSLNEFLALTQPPSFARNAAHRETSFFWQERGRCHFATGDGSVYSISVLTSAEDWRKLLTLKEFDTDADRLVDALCDRRYYRIRWENIVPAAALLLLLLWPIVRRYTTPLPAPQPQL